ncbi:hypothetical protein BRADI_5g13106v3 [Brachypodium distachyon]|uniref:Uncharacterized protein n=1 Tax=Brachypodium distachyon TaxID=15368 RepID=A0A2K2CGX7_BRADI|nr:hypothetical protein BRADI_5g13106v3 [Brachypodium distachyon]
MVAGADAAGSGAAGSISRPSGARRRAGARVWPSGQSGQIHPLLSTALFVLSPLFSDFVRPLLFAEHSWPAVR